MTSVGARSPGLRRAAGAMAASTVLSRATGFARVAALAWGFGYGLLADTYNLANTTPNIVYELVLGGVLSATLVPLFVERLSTRDDEDAWRSVSAVVTIAATATIALAALFWLLAPAIIRLYTIGRHGPEVALQVEAGTRLLRFFAPQVAAYGLISLFAAVLHARGRFVAPAITPVLNNLIVTGAIALAAATSDSPSLSFVASHRGLWILGVGTTAGVIVQALALLPSLRASGARLRPVWDPGHEAVRQMLRLSSWTVGYVVLNQIALWVVLRLANGGDPGDVSSYQSAQLFFVLPHAIVAVSVMTALQPTLAAAWAVNDRERFGARVADGIRASLLLLVPLAAAFIVLARPVIDTVLRYGKLSEASADLTATLLAIFLVGLPGFSTYLFCVRALQAVQDTRSAFWLYAIENGLNIALAFALAPAFGVQGLAAAYAIAYTVATLAALRSLARRVGGLPGPGIVDAARHAVPLAAAGAGAAALASRIGGPPAVRVIAGAAAALIAYLAVGRALGARVMEVLGPSGDPSEGKRP